MNKLMILPVLLAFSSTYLGADTLNVSGNLKNKAFLESAPKDGWAGVNEGTTGGNKATEDNIYIVNNISDLLALNSKLNDTPKIIQIEGIIDISAGKAYADFEDQKNRGQVFIPSNTTLVGLSKESGFKNGTLMVKDAKNIIIRNLAIEMPVDIAPKIEKDDGWNAEWDGINLINAQYVWLDHLTLTDGAFKISDYKTVDGLPYVQHDGMIDIKRESDFVTISWSHFDSHDKTMLIGHSDKFVEDRGKLNVTIHNTIFENVSQRMPRVRFGKVHSYNNLFVGDTIKPDYPFSYAFGLGYEGSVLSENNFFNINNLEKECNVIKIWNDNAFFKDSGTLVNGNAFRLFDNCHVGEKTLSLLEWMPPYEYELSPTEELKDKLTAYVGVQEQL